MTKNRIQRPCLDEKEVDGKRIYKYRKWLDRFKQYKYTKKYDTDIGPLIKEKTMTGNERDEKEEQIQQDSLWALELEATH